MFRNHPIHKRTGEMAKCPWIGKMTPFKIFGNTYFIGTYQASCHLIDTGDGLILIDPGYSGTAYLVIDSIYQLGFKPTDVKYILNTHWHGDHTEATAAFADLMGAKTLLGRDDAEKAAKYFVPDILIDDGDTLTLGRVTLEFMHTPGHTKGTVSFFYEDTDGERTCRVGMFGGAGQNTLVPGHYDFEGCREAYAASVERLMGEHVDLFIGNHTWNNDTYGKLEILRTTGRNEFVDETLWGKYLEHRKTSLARLIEKEKQSAN